MHTWIFKEKFFEVDSLDHAKVEAKPLEIKCDSLGTKCRFHPQLCLGILGKELVHKSHMGCGHSMSCYKVPYCIF